MGVIAGVHDHAADGGTDAHVTGAAGLTNADVLVVGVAHGSDGGFRIHGDLADFTGGQTYLSVQAFLGHELGTHASGANHLAAAAGLDLHIVDQCTNGDGLDGQRVAGLDIGSLAGDHGIAHLQVQRSQNVALLAVRVVQQGDEGAAVGVVLNAGNLRGDVHLIALEVDNAVLDLIAAALMANGDLALRVAAGVLLLVLEKGLFRLSRSDFLVRQHRHKAASGRGRLINSNSH